MSIPHARFSVEIVQLDPTRPTTDSKVIVDGCRDCLIRCLTNAILTMPDVRKIIELAVNNAAVRQAAEEVEISKPNLN